MYTHVSDVPCLPLASYRAALDGEAHVSPEAFQACARAIVASYRDHYQAVGLTRNQADEDAGDFILTVLDNVPAPILDAAGFASSPEGYLDPAIDGLRFGVTDATDAPCPDCGAALIEERGNVVCNACHFVQDANQFRTETLNDRRNAIQDAFHTHMLPFQDACDLDDKFTPEYRAAVSACNEEFAHASAELERNMAALQGVAICPICQSPLDGPHEACDLYVLANCPEDHEPQSVNHVTFPQKENDWFQPMTEGQLVGVNEYRTAELAIEGYFSETERGYPVAFFSPSASAYICPDCARSDYENRNGTILERQILTDNADASCDCCLKSINPPQHERDRAATEIETFKAVWADFIAAGWKAANAWTGNVENAINHATYEAVFIESFGDALYRMNDLFTTED